MSGATGHTSATEYVAVLLSDRNGVDKKAGGQGEKGGEELETTRVGADFQISHDQLPRPEVFSTSGEARKTRCLGDEIIWASAASDCDALDAYLNNLPLIYFQDADLETALRYFHQHGKCTETATREMCEFMSKSRQSEENLGDEEATQFMQRVVQVKKNFNLLQKQLSFQGKHYDTSQLVSMYYKHKHTAKAGSKVV